MTDEELAAAILAELAETRRLVQEPTTEDD